MAAYPAHTATSPSTATSRCWTPSLPPDLTMATRRRSLRIIRSIPARSIATRILSNSPCWERLWMINLAMTAIRSKASSPAYNVWDLTAEFRFWKGRAGVFAGIRNLFNEQYWGEVREEGIMPALPRNYYGGFEFFF